MPLPRPSFARSALAAALLAAAFPAAAEASSLQEFAASKWPELEKANAGAYAGRDGWLFLSADLRFLSAGEFWGAHAAHVARALRPELADPVPAIVDFQQQLKARGITLLLVPVPPKPAIMTGKLADGVPSGDDAAMASLRAFYQVLQASGVEVLDLSTIWPKGGESPEQGAMYCRTDTHWSGAGCALAAKAIAERLRPLLPASAAAPYRATWEEKEIQGDLPPLLPAGAPQPAPEKLRLRTVLHGGAGLEPDASSPLLVLGDSHTLVFHDFLAEHAGLLDQLALELGQAPDVLGTRGSGATPVRVSLYRRSVKDPAYLSRKKVVVWCFAAREFTEAPDGWPKVPVAK